MKCSSCLETIGRKTKFFFLDDGPDEHICEICGSTVCGNCIHEYVLKSFEFRHKFKDWPADASMPLEVNGKACNVCMWYYFSNRHGEPPYPPPPGMRTRNRRSSGKKVKKDSGTAKTARSRGKGGRATTSNPEKAVRKRKHPTKRPAKKK